MTRTVCAATAAAGHLLPLVVGIVLGGWAGAGRAQGDPAAQSAAVSAWSTGGASATAKPTDAEGKPGGAGAGAVPVALPYWQAPAVPTAVIQGGAIPPGWQPQAVPYQGIGPDGRPITMYVAPTYVFTYQVGPPVMATPQVNRRQAGGVNRPGAPVNPYANGWNYRSSGATPVAPVLPPPTVSRYAPQPYQFPTDARALTGTPVVPPAPLPPPPAPQAWAVPPPVMAASPPPAPDQPPVGWAPVNAAPANMGPPPAGWTGVAPSAAPAPPPGFAAAPLAATAATAGAAVAAAPPPPSSPPPPPLAALPPPVTPIQAAPPPGPQPIPVANASLSAPQSASASNIHAWKVVAVYDGDTVTCLDENNQQQKVRLADIDAPESGQDFGKASREALATMVFGRTVQVVDSGRDRYGRWIGRLSVDGTDVNREMVATGMAWHYAEYSQDDTLAAVQAQAQAQKVGLWSQPNPMPPADYRRQASQKT